MLSTDSVVAFALLEYRRSTKFKAFVDAEVAALREAGALQLGEPLEAILERKAKGGLPLAKVWLSVFEDQASQPQWQRAREAM